MTSVVGVRLSPGDWCGPHLGDRYVVWQPEDVSVVSVGYCRPPGGRFSTTIPFKVVKPLFCSIFPVFVVEKFGSFAALNRANASKTAESRDTTPP